MDKLLIQDFFELKELDKPTEAWKDQRKLSKFLYGIHEVVNTLIRACQQQSRLVANELIARPTYAEEFQNIRKDVHKVVAPNNNGTFSCVGSDIESRLGNNPFQRKSTLKSKDEFLDSLKNADINNDSIDEPNRKQSSLSQLNENFPQPINKRKTFNFGNVK